MTVEAKAKLISEFVGANPYIPHTPFANQIRFLSLLDIEALYGGAAGGGKSDALLMAALMFVDFPGYNAILFRKTYSDLALPEAIMTRSHDWLANTDASWNGGDYRWTFPSGATLSFGYMNHDKDRYRYQSSAFQFIGFDELTQFPSNHYRYMFSRLRRLSHANIPLRMRGGTNPGGVGHDWVYERFVADPSRPFIPSRLGDNPYLDKDQYEKALAELDDTTRRQLLGGEWVIDPAGKPFRSDWWRGQNRFHLNDPDDPWFPYRRWISLDTALEIKESNDHTAWSVGELGRDYSLRILDVGQERLIFPDLLDQIRHLAHKWNRDGKLAGILIEGAASGKPAVQSLRRSLEPSLARLIVEVNPKGSKVERANRAAVWAKRGVIYLPHPSLEAEWVSEFETELFHFPDVEHDDRVDSMTQLAIYLENFLATGWHGIKKTREKKGPVDRVSRILAGKRKMKGD